jgi:hypothetical protein
MRLEEAAPLELGEFFSVSFLQLCRSSGAGEILFGFGFYKDVAPPGLGKFFSVCLSVAEAGQAGCLPYVDGCGDWKVPGTRRQECLRYVARAFQPAGSGDSPVAGRASFPSFPSVKKNSFRLPPAR